MQDRENVLITGATGFIGRHLVRRLLRDGRYNVLCLTRNPKKAKLLEAAGALVVSGNITDPFFKDNLACRNINILFHCAAGVSNKNRKLLYKANVKGTENACAFALDVKVKRMVYLSSVAVVSGNPSSVLTEDMPFAVTNLYGESKAEAEKKALVFRDRGLPLVILRPPMIYGPDEPHMLKLLLTLLKYRLLPLFAEGKSKLHLGYVENVIEAMLFSLSKEDFLQGAFFAADKEVLTVKEVFEIFSEAIGGKPPFCAGPFLEKILLQVPYVGKRLKFFAKDREYSMEKMASVGFIPPYSARECMAKSAKACFQGSYGGV